jgi:hypothetical protein
MSDAIHEQFMRETLELARQMGEWPFTALLAVRRSNRRYRPQHR